MSVIFKLRPLKIELIGFKALSLRLKLPGRSSGS
jgi:hypothetical protein